MSITQQEAYVNIKICEAWDGFLKLPDLHPDDTEEFRHHIHALQHMIFARQALVEYNTQFKEENNGRN